MIDLKLAIARRGLGHHKRRFKHRTLLEVSLYPALIMIVLIGLRISMITPYLPLFAVEQAHLSPLALGAFFIVRAGGAILFSVLLCAWFDHRPSLLPFGLSLIVGSIGSIMLLTTTNIYALLLIAGLPLGMGAASFPLAFALARVSSDDVSVKVSAERRVMMLRVMFSMSWAVGPGLGGEIVSTSGYGGLFGVSAACSMLACLPLLFIAVVSPSPQKPRVSDGGNRDIDLKVILASTTLVLYALAIGIGEIILPITITSDLSGDAKTVGVAASVCAIVELPIMGAIVLRPNFFPPRRSMAIGLAILSGYFVAVALADSVSSLIYWQFLRAIGMGMVSCLGIGYLQDLMPNRAGAAAALYANAGQIGSLLAGAAAGPWAHILGYHSLFWACAVASIAAFLILQLIKIIRVYKEGGVNVYAKALLRLSQKR